MILGYAAVRPFLYYDHFHIFDPPTLLSFLAKLYFDQNCTPTCTSRPIRSPDFTKCRSTEVEVERSKYRKGRTHAYPDFRIKMIAAKKLKRRSGQIFWVHQRVIAG